MPPKVSSSTGKRRPSAYISFSTQNRESVKRELAEKGNLKPGMGDIAKLISQRWNGLTEEEKQKFKEKCEREFDEKEEKERKEREERIKTRKRTRMKTTWTTWTTTTRVTRAARMG
jgi:hypothetical protein